jgi:hypothetical protein
MKRLFLLAAALLLVCAPGDAARRARNAGGNPAATGCATADGTQIRSDSGLTLCTAYGTWGFGPFFAPPAAYTGNPPANLFSGSPMGVPYLNGKPVCGFSQQFGCAVQGLRIDNGGNLYAFTFDQTWIVWANYFWDWAGSPDLVISPQPPLPTVPATITPSSDFTTITGPVGTVTSVDGVWTFAPTPIGGCSGTGYIARLNGIPVANSIEYIDVIQINSNGRAFLHVVNDCPARWTVWTANKFQLATGGPTAGPIPVNVLFSAAPCYETTCVSYAQFRHVTTPPFVNCAQTFLTSVSVVMSDGSPFSGTLSNTFSADVKFCPSPAGPDIYTAQTPIGVGGQFWDIAATQNGVVFTGYFSMNSDP